MTATKAGGCCKGNCTPPTVSHIESERLSTHNTCTSTPHLYTCALWVEAIAGCTTVALASSTKIANLTVGRTLHRNKAIYYVQQRQTDVAKETAKPSSSRIESEPLSTHNSQKSTPHLCTCELWGAAIAQIRCTKATIALARSRFFANSTAVCRTFIRLHRNRGRH